jgi:hypothetical protein
MEMLMSKAENGKRKPPAAKAMSRLEFEMALEIAETGGTPWTDTVRIAAEATGSDFLFVLPVPADDGGMSECAFVRLPDDENGRIVNVSKDAGMFSVRDEADIDSDLLGFARASIDVLERLKADERVLAAAS